MVLELFYKNVPESLYIGYMVLGTTLPRLPDV